MFRLDGKAIIVTGSCQGVGKAIALACTEAGAQAVVITGLEKERAEGEEVAKKTKGVFIAADLREEEDCRELVKRAAAEYGNSLQCLVNAAGVTHRATLNDTTTQLYTEIFRINLLAPFVLTQELSYHLKARNLPGSVVNISSVQAHGGMPQSMAYSALKAALIVQGKNNAKELLKSRIRVNSILPGWMPTQGEIDLQHRLGAPATWLETADKGAPLGRLLRPRECALTAVFLLSDAACMTTGTAMDLHPEMITGCLPDGTGDGHSPQVAKL